jgi:hypothetical protein
MSFAEYQRERTSERARQSKYNNIFPVHDIPFAIFRLAEDDQAVKNLALAIAEQGVEQILPSEILAKDEHGKLGIQLSILDNIENDVKQKLRATPGALDLLRYLNEDRLLSGEESIEIQQFRHERERIAREVGSEIVNGLRKETDFDYELVGDATEHSFTTEEEKKAFEKLQTFAQGIVKKLFQTAGLKYLQPKVHVTRSREVNAWVLNVGKEDAVAEYLATAQKSEAPLELPIYIHYGLFQAVKSEDALAGVLAHEFAHLLQPNYLGLTASDTRQRLEYDADVTALHVANATGFNPRGLIQFIDQFSDSGFLQKFGWGTHPDSPRRMIELEKELNRADVPLPNTAKAISSLPTEIQQAVATIETTKRPKLVSVGNTSAHWREKHDQRKKYASEAYLEEHSEPEFFLSFEMQKLFNAEANRRVTEVFIEQELAHDVVGYRTQLLRTLETCLIGLYQREHLPPGEEIQLKCSIKTPDRQKSTQLILGSLPENVLSLPHDPLYMGSKINLDHAKKSLEEKNAGEITRQTYLLKKSTPEIQNAYASEWKTKTIEDWIDPDNKTVQPFWDEIVRIMSRIYEDDRVVVPTHLTREERLYQIHHLLSELVSTPQYNSYGDSSVMTLVKQKPAKKEEYESVQISHVDQPDVLSHIDLHGRAQRRSTIEKPTFTTTKKIVAETQNEIITSLVPEGHDLVKSIWDCRSEKMPPVVQPYTALVQEKTVLAYQELRRAHRLPKCDETVARYVCARLFDSAFYSGQYQGKASNAELSLEFAPEMTIGFFDQAVQVLESRQLANLFDSVPEELKNRQKTALEGLRCVIAFGLSPADTDEAKIQQEYLRRIELYQRSSNGLVNDTIPSHIAVPSATRYATTHPSTNGTRFELKYLVADVTAVSERNWSELSDVVEEALKGRKPRALMITDRFRSAEPEADDSALVRENVRAHFPIPIKQKPTKREQLAKALDFLPAVVRAYVDNLYLQGAATKASIAQLYAGEIRFLENKNHDWDMLFPLMSTLAKSLYERFGRDLTFSPYTDSRVPLTQQQVGELRLQSLLFVIARSSIGVAARMKHARFATVDSPALERQVAPIKVPLNHARHASELPFLYTPHQSPEQYLEMRAIHKERAIEYLKILAPIKPAALELADVLKKWPKKQNFPPELAIICMGHFVKFQSDYYSASNPEVIKIWRLAAAVYHDEWQQIEQYKSLDEQLSTWEWTRKENPLFKGGVVRKWRKRDMSYEISENGGDQSLANFIEYNLGDELYLRYQTAASKHTTLKFSWPLFITDVWEGQLIFTDPEKTAKYQPLIHAFRAELRRIVADPDNLTTIKKMQPGFFREFLLAKKIELLDISDLDSIEPWLRYFTSRPHEASERNQVSAVIEAQRKDHRDKRKEELLVKALYDVLPQKSWGKFFYYNVSLASTTLTDVSVQINFNALQLKTALDAFEEERRNINADHAGTSRMAAIDQELAELRQLRHTAPDLIRLAYAGYKTNIEATRDEATATGKTDEQDVMLFSDQIIENNRSRLHVGPVYRYRLAAQKAMDWHADALPSAKSLDEASKLYQRVDRVFPERHPLKDIFIKNQLAVEIWHILTASLSRERLTELGVALTKKSVDLEVVLDNLPLYKEAAFLKQYALFEVTNLEKVIIEIPNAVADDILQRIERSITEEISADQQNLLRRLFMQLEKTARWPELRAARRSDARVFNRYLERIITLYPEPSFERDDVLESIAMDLAYTPAEIRQVTHLTYAEQTRWPKEDEAKSLRPQHTVFEQLRGMLTTLEPVERANYIIWFAGGPMPLSEALSTEKTHISVQGRAKSFWSLSANERRIIVYDFCLGKKGVMEVPKPFSGSSEGKPWPEWERDTDMIAFIADNLFNQAFGNSALNPDYPPDHPDNLRGREMIETIFRELFIHQPNAGRRAELLANILEAIGSVRREGRNLRPGELIRVLLEQIGVVGIKIGQILSEQVGLLPESIRQDLLQLKDQTAQFSKRGILTYLESAGWVQGDESKVVMIGEALGSASIKQVQDGQLDDDREVAIKAKRPSVDKNYQTDMRVVELVFRALEQKGFSMPSYLIPEVNRSITEELSFVHEVENQVAMSASLIARKARLELNFSGTHEVVPLAVSAPVAVSEVLYPGPEQTADIGLIVEEKVKGLSLKEIQTYQTAMASRDDKLIKKFREKVARLYDTGRVEAIESKIRQLDVTKLQASLALEFLRQVVTGGIFHADLHSGNFYLDFTPQIIDGEVYNQRAVLIDLGSTGYSKAETRAPYLQGESPKRFAGAEQFRDFLSALFSQTPKPGTIAEIVNRFTNLTWDATRVQAISENIDNAGEKVKKIFYAILDEGRGTIDNQFRYFLKAVATAADHLTKLRMTVEPEIDLIKTNRVTETVILPQLINEGLLNIGLLL